MRRGLIVAILGFVALILWVVRERAQQPESAPPAAVVAAIRAPDELVLVTEPTPARHAIGAEPAAEPIVATVDSGAKHRLHGVVRPAVGRKELLSNIAVGATDVGGQAQSTYCLHGGSYAFENLLPGRYWLHISSLQNGRSDAVVDVFGDTRHDFQLSTIEIEVRVVDEISKPSAVLGLLAVATADEPGEWMDEVRSGFADPIALGRFTRPIWPDSESLAEVLGLLYLERAPPLYVSLCRYQRVLETRRIEARTEGVKFVLRSDDALLANGSIRVRAVDAETAEPIPKLTGLAEGAANRMSSAQAGVCEFQDLLPGTYRIQLMAKDRGMVRREVRVRPGEVVDLGDVPMDKAHWVSGRILDETGEEREFDIRYDPCEADGGVREHGGSIYAFPTKPDGTFRVTGLASGFHRLEVMTRGQRELAECVAVFDVRDGPVENVTLTVRTGVLLVVDPNGGHGPSPRFSVLDEKGVRIVSRALREPAPVRVRLAPGRYTVEFKSSREDPDPRTSSFEIVREPVVVRMR